MSRLLIVSNRLPFTVKPHERYVELIQSNGGLATGLMGPFEKTRGLWVGWPGPTHRLPGNQQQRLQMSLIDKRLVPVMLSEEEVEAYYEKFSNGFLWPLFHYFLSPLAYEAPYYDYYRKVNEKFAEVVLQHHQTGDFIWVHDYHLMLLPGLLREKLPNARIGFFLHIPFPSIDVFRALPVKREILNGLLGANLIGFHLSSYLRHFEDAVEEWASTTGPMKPRLGVFPMGVAGRNLTRVAKSESVQRHLKNWSKSKSEHWFVGVDRMDYTKGIPQRLMAFEKLLQKHPELLGKVRFIQVAVPSRCHVKAYQDIQSQVESLVGRLTGRFATPQWTPVHYVFRALTMSEVVGLYRAADVLLVTPLRDGMNLVAKEFVASRPDQDGVLVLSEFTGASEELSHAIDVNPFDVGQMADIFFHALQLPLEERHRRMRAMRRQVLKHDVDAWVNSFLVAAESEEKALPESWLQ